MALDSFFHNKIESMKLEIIQGQAVLRRLEAQRNDYNSRGSITIFPSQLLGLIPSSTAAQGRAGVAATTWILRW
jgi:26S proteasome regulatory subunit T6